VPLPADDHVHSEWSYDTGVDASMFETCREAVRLGLPAVAFTEHLDHLSAVPGDLAWDRRLVLDYPDYTAALDVDGYLASLERCQRAFPGLRVRSGVEAGEAHLFAASLAPVLDRGDFERVLGSVHGLPHEGSLVQVETLYDVLPPADVMRLYFDEVLALVEGSSLFEVLAHLDYARRHWPRRAGPYVEAAFEQEYRAVLAALSGSGRVLEVNTLTPLASVRLVRWWWQAGGRAVSFGSDAHVPWRVGESFATAVAVVEAAGFRAGRDALDFWCR
jgi:histidinol-phosphatase (PHP family)